MDWSDIHCLLAASGTRSLFIDFGTYSQWSVNGELVE